MSTSDHWVLFDAYSEQYLLLILDLKRRIMTCVFLNTYYTHSFSRYIQPIKT